MLAEHKQLIDTQLFLGMSAKDMDRVMQSIHLKVRHHKKGQCIAKEGDAATQLVIVSEGWMQVETLSDNKSYKLIELMEAPQLLEPDKLFGLTQTLRSSYMAYTTCTSVAIPKEDVIAMITEYPIIRINLLNVICRKTQKMEHIPWTVTGMELRDRIVKFIKQRCYYPAGKKVLKITMAQLAHELNANRLDVSKALNRMADEEKILITRGIITVPALQLL